MPKPPRRVPSYRHYTPKNLGVVRVNGQDQYLGPYNSPESWETYHRLIAEWLASGCQSLPKRDQADATPQTPTINELILAYWHLAKSHYLKDGVPT
jgi:hypothetical protein